MLLLLLLLTPLSGCKRPTWETPVEAYLTFVRLAQKGDTKRAFKGLSTPTQRALAARAEAAAQASGGALKAEPERHFFAAGPRPAEVTQVEVVEQDEAQATLKVVSDGLTRTVKMVKEAEGWRVDLSDELRDRPAASSP